MQPVITAEQMREIDRLTVEDYSTPSILLMEAAASACLFAINTHFSGDLAGKKARILCGKGNNGGDGAALARNLARIGIPTDVVLFGRVDETRGDARTNFEIVRSISSFEAGSNAHGPPLSFIECDSVSSWEQIASPRQNYHLIVDALFGTGLSRPLEGIYLQVVQHLNLLRSARERASGERPLIVSLDVPSGLDADSSQPIGEAVRADLTVTFTAPKPANVIPPASHFCGELKVANVGSPLALIESAGTKLFLSESEDARQWLRQTRYEPDSHKNTHGHVLIVGGSRGYTGAAALCGDAAIRSGAGLVTIATPASAQAAVAASTMPEVITTALAETDRGSVTDEAVDHALGLASKATVLAIGPGLTAADDRTRRFVNSVVARRTTPVIIDADGLNCLAPWPNEVAGTREYPIVITPHPGEMLRLIGASDMKALADRVNVVSGFASRHHVIVVLKGSRSLIGAPDGRVFVNPTGNPGLGKAGSGDTLTGLIAGLVAQAIKRATGEESVLTATIAALYIGGLAGDLAAQRIGMRTMVASDVREQFAGAIHYLNSDCEP